MGKSERRRRPTNYDNASSYDALAYEHIADEYYNSSLHPTCSNFRDASLKVIREFALPTQGSNVVLDLGAGKSVLSEVLIGYESAVLVDSSIKMISHSLFLFGRPSHLVHMVVADARQLPFASEIFDIIIISLGDPFNSLPLWKNVGRVMKASGVCVFTTPSYDWATRFRWLERDEAMDRALFIKNGSKKRFVPSFVYDTKTQNEMFEEAGLIVRELKSVTVSQLSKPISWKLLIDGDELSVVTAYLLERRVRRQAPPR